MRDPLTLYSSPHDPAALLYDVSCQAWPTLTLHTWSPPSAQEPLYPKTQPEEAMGASAMSQERRKTTKKIKKKKYERHAKPPYSYLAMIALVIQNSPDKMLKLSQILKHIEILFPFFRRDYIGWKDSVRHNLSSNDCFRKVLKDPGKPQAKGNFWTVDVSRIPLEAMKLQNTVLARGGSTFFVQDLSPYILHNQKYVAGADAFQGSGSLPAGDECHPNHLVNKLNTSFMIESLLQGLQDVDLADVSKSMERRMHGGLVSGSAWPSDPRGHVSGAQSLYSSSSTSLSTSSDGGSPPPPLRSRISTKRPREDEDPRSVSSSDSEADRCSPPCPPPPAKVPFLSSDLPTSYTKCVAPNMVAPPNVLPFFPLPQFGYYNYGSSPYMSPTYWGLVPPSGAPHPEPPGPPAPSLDLDNMLRAVPPNKSVFDVLSSHPGDVVHPAFFTQYLSPGQRLA